MSVILDAIKENLRKIKIVYEPTEGSFRPDTKNTGNIREVTIKEFIESFFPSTYQVKKGLIFSMDSASQEIDCVLLAPNHPRLVTPMREIIIAEGVHAAIEIKPDISVLTEGSEFYRGLKQIRSVKDLKREISTVLGSRSLSIPCVIFSNKSRPLGDITSYMIKLIQKGEFTSAQFPDLILTIDNGIIFHTSSASDCLFKNQIASIMPTRSTENVFIEIPYHDSTLALFLLLLYSFTPPEPYMTAPILKKYFGEINIPLSRFKQY